MNVNICIVKSIDYLVVSNFYCQLNNFIVWLSNYFYYFAGNLVAIFNIGFAASS